MDIYSKNITFTSTISITGCSVFSLDSRLPDYLFHLDIDYLTLFSTFFMSAVQGLMSTIFNSSGVLSSFNL